MDHVDYLKRAVLEAEGLSMDRLDALLQHPSLQEILEEYVLVTDAFDHWKKTNGIASHEASQYRGLIRERAAEIKAFVCIEMKRLTPET